MSTATATAAGVRLTQMPKVDLLPPEIAAEATFRRLRLGLGLGVAAAVGIVGLLWYSAHSQVASAQSELTAAQQTQTRLQVEVTKYADVPKTYAAVTAAEAQLTAAMGNEVRFSFILNDLSMTIPDKVWLHAATITQDVDGTSPPTGAWGNTGIATLNVDGFAYNYPDVAAWLQMLGKGKYYTDPYFSDAHQGELIGTHKNVAFNSSVVITDKAYSGRYKTGSSR
jgi:Tfp pilus assembly protein PilN